MSKNDPYYEYCHTIMENRFSIFVQTFGEELAKLHYEENISDSYEADDFIVENSVLWERLYLLTNANGTISVIKEEN